MRKAFVVLISKSSQECWGRSLILTEEMEDDLSEKVAVYLTLRGTEF